MYLRTEGIQKRSAGFIPNIPIQELPLGWADANTAVACVFIVLAWFSVSLRWYTRIYYTKMGGDDVAIALAVVFLTVFSCGIMAIELQVVGRSSIDSDKMTMLTNILLVIEVFYVWAMIFLKLSLALFFLRLLQEPWQKRAVYIISGSCIISSFGYFWFIVFQCGVPSGWFWLRMESHQCVSDSGILGYGYANGVITALTDILLAIMPIPMIQRIKMCRREKAIVIGIILFAVIGCIASCIRVPYVRTLINHGNGFWNSVQPLALTSMIEPGVGIIASSLATLRPLLKSNAKLLKSTIFSTSEPTSKPISRITQSGGTQTPMSPTKALESRNTSPTLNPSSSGRSSKLSRNAVATPARSALHLREHTLRSLRSSPVESEGSPTNTRNVGPNDQILTAVGVRFHRAVDWHIPETHTQPNARLGREIMAQLDEMKPLPPLPKSEYFSADPNELPPHLRRPSEHFSDTIDLEELMPHVLLSLDTPQPQGQDTQTFEYEKYGRS